MGPTVLGSNKNKQTNTYLTFSKKKKKKISFTNLCGTPKKS